jgi:hypothetical protein
MKRKVSYAGIVDQGRSVGFIKKKKERDPDRSNAVRINVHVNCIRTRLMIYSLEDKAGYKIGDFIKRDTRKNLEKYKANGGFSCVVFKKKED